MSIFRSIPNSIITSVHAFVDPFAKRRHRGGSKKRRSRSNKHGSKRTSKSMRRKSFRR